MRRTTITVAIATAAFVVGCGGGDNDKAGGAGGITTLEVGSPDRPDRPGSDALERIARDVERRSDGRLRLKIVHESQTREGPRNAADGDQVVAKQVREGDLDLGMVPSRAWDVLGVKSFEALQAPFLITTDDLLAQVVGGNLGDQMLAGVQKAGVVGLGLQAESLRHPVGYGRSLTKLADFQGKQIEARRSDATYALLRALGAQPIWYADERRFKAALAKGQVVGVESSYALSGTHGVGQPVVSGNVTFFPKVNVLVANENMLGALSDAERDILRTSAEAERQRSIRTLSETAAAGKACAQATAIQNAKPADLAALRKAARPVTAQLRSDESTASMIDAIGRLDSLPAVAPEPCEGATTPDAAPVAMRGPTGKLPLGTYRFRVSDEKLQSRGLDTNGIQYNAGLYTAVLKSDGTWQLTHRPAHDVDTPTEWGGDFSVKGDRVITTVRTLEEAKGFRDEYRWSFADGELKLSPLKLQRADRVWTQLGGAWLPVVPWQKIG